MSEKPVPPAPVPTQNLQVAIDEAEAQGIYSNLVLISHSNSEVILDFARALPGLPKAKVHARLILTPFHARALHRALGDNLAKFETQWGPIAKGPQEDPGKAIGFRS
jgi:hypothetical protein